MCQNKGNNMFNFPLRRCLGQRKDLVVIPAYCILLSRERRVSQYHSWDSAKTEPSGSRTRDTGGWSPGTHRNTDLRTGQGHLGTGLRDTAVPCTIWRHPVAAQSTAVVRSPNLVYFRDHTDWDQQMPSVAGGQLPPPWCSPARRGRRNCSPARRRRRAGARGR